MTINLSRVTTNHVKCGLLPHSNLANAVPKESEQANNAKSTDLSTNLTQANFLPETKLCQFSQNHSNNSNVCIENTQAIEQYRNIQNHLQREQVSQMIGISFYA